MEVIQIENFSFAYPHHDAIFGPLNLSVEEGSFVLLVGNTGSGKTTLMRCLKQEIAPVGEKRGSLRVFGEEPTAGVAQTSVGYVFQNPETQIVCDTVWHELAFGLESVGCPASVMRRRVAEVANFFGIANWVDAQTDELSGGQKQLVNLASVLALRPRLLLLDEPTAQLDPVAARNFLHELFRVNRELGITVVVATHEPELAADYATRAIALREGQLIECDVAHYAHKTPLDAAFAAASSALPTSKEVLSARDIYVRYSRDAACVLRGLDISLRKGSIHALVGGNGCGKSTLLGTIAGTLKPARGKLQNSCASSQALLSQDPKALFVCDTVLEELQEWQQGARYSNQDIHDMLQRFSLLEAQDRHPYDLSGGQQQLLAFAKVLLVQPHLLLLDEPTKGLDTQAKLELARILKQEQAKGTSILMSTHDLSFTLALADTVSMLFDGQIVCTQATQKFFCDNLFYRPLMNDFLEAWTELAQ